MVARQGVSDLPLGGTAHGPGEERVAVILAIAREVLSEPGLTADDELAGHGGTSLSIVRIVAVASRALGLDINPRDLGAVTVRNLARAAHRSPPPEAGP